RPAPPPPLPARPPTVCASFFCFFRVIICPPRCRMGAITPEERTAVRGRSPVGGKYDKSVNRESAYEILGKRGAGADAPPGKAGAGPGAAPTAPRGKEQAPAQEQGSGLGQQVSEILWGTKRRQGMVEAMAKQAARTVGSQVGRQILRGVLGGMLGRG